MSVDRAPLPYEPGQVRAELQRRVLSLLPALGINDQPRAGLVTPRNPTRTDRHPGSFVIWTNADAAGAWKEYATGEGGDVYKLILYLGGLRDWIDAYWWALEFLGWGRGVVRTATQDQAARELRERERKAAEARQGAELDKQVKAMRAFWLASSSEIRDTPVWSYLTQARGLPMDQLLKPPGALRFRPALDHFDKETGEITAWPAMVSAMSHWNGGEVRAIHRTWLAPDGLGKAPLDKSKKMKGPADGCAVRVWKGAGALSPERAAKDGVRGPLVITEGIEDAITAAIAQPDYRVWAAGSLSLLGKLGWPECASAVVLVADNDWDKPQALAAFEKVLAYWQGMAAGRPLKVVRAQTGKDLNDWARGEG